MNRIAICLVLAVLVAAAGTAGQPAFRTSVQTVAIHATVQDASGRLVPDLTRERFSVLDNGKPVEVTTFSSEVQPITVALMLDMSGSMMSRVLLVRESTLKFINALLPQDRARIGSFGNEISISPILTGDKGILSRIVEEEFWPGGGTPLWNAMHAAMDSLSKETGRRIVLVLTDGMDGGSLPGWKGDFGDVRDRATREGFMLYAVGMEGLLSDDGAKRKFQSLIADTGGGHFQLSEDDDLQSTFVGIANELRHQYLIGFTPAAADGREHRLEVRVSGSGLRVRARKNYVAARQ